MKLLVEAIIALVFHPIAVVLSWINLLGRDDLATPARLLWGLICLIWGIGPILYILLGDGELW